MRGHGGVRHQQGHPATMRKVPNKMKLYFLHNCQIL